MQFRMAPSLTKQSYLIFYLYTRTDFYYYTIYCNHIIHSIGLISNAINGMVKGAYAIQVKYNQFGCRSTNPKSTLDVAHRLPAF